MRFAKRKFICLRKKDLGAKSISFIVFVILCTFMQGSMSFAKGQSEKGTHINQKRRSVGDLVKLRSEITSTLMSEKNLFTSKTSNRNEHHNIEKKSSSTNRLVNNANPPQINIMPFYSDLFYEEKSEPTPSTVSPFGKYSLYQSSILHNSYHR